MTPQRWQQVECVLQAALDLPPHERSSFLDEACAGDKQMKEEAASLIDAYNQAGDFIEEPAIAQDASIFVAEDVDCKLGRELGPYKILERLGVGGMGEVYLAKDTRLDRLVALKILPAYFALDEARLRRFQREARAASALNHPNILTIHEVGEEGGVYFIATEFIDGQTIRELVREQQLSLEEILDIAEQVASALAAAHAAGIVHRDIKPENIMRRADGLVKILDFGIAKLLEPRSCDNLSETQPGVGTHTEAGLIVGTANYMSPEQARALPVDERTDIWSVGVVLFEMLTERLPFTGATRMDTMVAILEREPPMLSDLGRAYYSRSPLLQRIVNQCLCKEIAQRYRSASELLSALRMAEEQLKTGLTNAAELANLPKASQRSARLRSWPTAGVAVLLIAGLAGIVLYR